MNKQALYKSIITDVAKIVKKHINENDTMKRYIVCFVTTDGDYEKEWCYAESEQQACDNIMREHWDIDRIVYACEE